MKRFLVIFNILSASLFFVFGCKETTPEEKINKGLSQAKQELTLGNKEQALSTLETLDIEFPNNARITEEIALLMSELNKPNTAGMYEKAFQLSPHKTEYLLRAALFSSKNGDIDQTVNYLNKYLEKEPQSAQGWLMLGDFQYQKKENAKAINAYVAAIKLNKSNYTARTAERLGELYYNLGRYNDALPHLRNAVKTNSGYKPQALIIAIMAKEKDFSEMDIFINDFEKKFPQHSNEIVEAKTAFNEYKKQITLKKETERKLVEAEAARKLEEQRKQEEAARQAEQARIEAQKQKEQEIAIEKAKEEQAAKAAETERQSKIVPYIENAREAKDKGDLAKASQELRYAIAEDSENAALWYDLSRTLVDQNLWEQGQVAALEATRLSPDNFDYALYYLQLLPETNQFNKVADEITRVYMKFPQKHQVLFWMAERYRTQKSIPEATYLYKEFLRRSPDIFPYREEARKALSEMSGQ